jgi:hypothetical protein
MSEPLTIDVVLAQIASRLQLSREQERDVLDELRNHLEEAVADAIARGEDETVALLKAAEKLGVDDVGVALQEVHAGEDVAHAIVASALPVLLALLLRWLAFAPDGSARAWPMLLARPGFWVVAAVALLAPLLLFHRWRYALLGWGVFWLLTVLFVAFPAINQW